MVAGSDARGLGRPREIERDVDDHVLLAADKLAVAPSCVRQWLMAANTQTAQVVLQPRLDLRSWSSVKLPMSLRRSLESDNELSRSNTPFGVYSLGIVLWAQCGMSIWNSSSRGSTVWTRARMSRCWRRWSTQGPWPTFGSSRCRHGDGVTTQEYEGAASRVDREVRTQGVVRF